MFFLALYFSLFAEYRVYLLDLEKTDNTNIVIKSNLDHIQFSTYYPGFKKITLLDSWMCFGDTSNNKKFCEKKEGIVKAND